MNKKISFPLYLALAVVSAAMLVMTILASAGVKGVWNGMPVMIVLLVLGIAIAISLIAFNPRMNAYSIGFYLSHLGIVLFLIGSFVFTVGGSEIYVDVPNRGSFTPVIEHLMVQDGAPEGYKDKYYNEVGSTGEDGLPTTKKLGFNFRVAAFKTETYEDGSVKHYEATLEFLENGQPVEKSLTVNHPLYYGDWKIYLMDVGVNERYGFQEVRLLFKRDPTEFLSTGGILLIIVGTLMICLIRPRDKTASGEEAAALKKKRENLPKKAGRGGASK